IDYVSPFRVSKYGVNLRIFESIGVEAINEAMRTSKIIVIDEIGKMELFSEKFKETLIRALDSKKKVLATITLSNIDFVNKIKRRSDCDIIFLSRENFDFNLNKIRKWVLIGEVK
ncbi:nucleoside-triphosphatase, partial [Candidatus Aminicenantes bacterium AC-335-G13]|nr:nucleoside-triphosphatase [Candidatus Aminicenantes bacterium AC-335-G13]